MIIYKIKRAKMRFNRKGKPFLLKNEKVLPEIQNILFRTKTLNSIH